MTAVRGKDINMKIAIIAHDAKKELMVQFCSAYCGILSKHTLIATNTTGKQVSEATGLPIKRYLSGQGGAEQILALLSCNEVDVLLFFRDPEKAVIVDDAPDTPPDLSGMAFHHLCMAISI